MLKQEKQLVRVPAGSLWKKSSPGRGLETNIFVRSALQQMFFN